MAKRSQPVTYRQGVGEVRSGVLRFATGTLTQVAGEAVFTPPGGGGGGDHATLTNLGWTASAHTGTADRLAGFSGAGAAVAASVSAPLAYGSSALSLSGWSGTTDGDMIYRSGGTVATKTPAQARTWLDLASLYQPLDADLTGLAGLGDGLPVRSGGTWAANSLGDLAVSGGSMQATQARGLRETGGPTTLAMGAVADGEVLQRSGTSIVGAAIGSVLQAYNALLAAIAGLGSNGLIARTSSTTVAARTIEGTTGIAVSNGDGVSGNPSISLDASAKAVVLWNPFFIVQPKGPTQPDVDGGGVLSAVGVLSSAASSASFRAVQFGDASTALCRYYVQGYYQSQEGTWEAYFLFQMLSDITTGTQTYYMGFSSVVSVNVADPSGHRAMLRYISGTDTTWKLSVKDGTTQTTVDTGITVTASHYVAARLIMTASAVTLYVSSSATVAGAKSGLAGASANTTSSNIPGSTNDLYWVQSVNRSAASTARGFKMAYVSSTCTP